MDINFACRLSVPTSIWHVQYVCWPCRLGLACAAPASASTAVMAPSLRRLLVLHQRPALGVVVTRAFCRVDGSAVKVIRLPGRASYVQQHGLRLTSALHHRRDELHKPGVLGLLEAPLNTILHDSDELSITQLPIV